MPGGRYCDYDYDSNTIFMFDAIDAEQDPDDALNIRWISSGDSKSDASAANTTVKPSSKGSAVRAVSAIKNRRIPLYEHLERTQKKYRASLPDKVQRAPTLVLKDQRAPTRKTALYAQWGANPSSADNVTGNVIGPLHQMPLYQGGYAQWGACPPVPVSHQKQVPYPYTASCWR